MYEQYNGAAARWAAFAPVGFNAVNVRAVNLQPVNHLTPVALAPVTAGKTDAQQQPQDFTFGGKISGIKSAEDLAQWSRYCRMSPLEFLEKITDGLPGEAHLSLRGNGNQGLFQVRLRDAQGRRIMSASRRVDLKNEVVQHVFINIHRDYAGHGLGRQFILNSIRLYRKLGVDSVELYATLQNGAYTWARFGWLPYVQTWHFIQPRLAEQLQTVAAQLSAEHLDELKQAIHSDDPRGIWTLVDHPAKVTDDKGKVMNIGKYLLLGEYCQWLGYLNLHDPLQMARFCQYVGDIAPLRDQPPESAMLRRYGGTFGVKPAANANSPTP